MPPVAWGGWGERVTPVGLPVLGDDRGGGPGATRRTAPRRSLGNARLAILVDPALAGCEADKRCSARDVVTIEEATELAFDGLDAQRQALGDLGVRETLGDERKDLQLAGVGTRRASLAACRAAAGKAVPPAATVWTALRI